MPTTVDVFKKYFNRVLIETGSGSGEGIGAALMAGFDQVISIELSPKMFSICSDKYKDNKQVCLFFGDSQEMLDQVLKEINEPVTFWLDAHASGGDTAGADLPPLMEELAIIKKHSIKTHTILIDDLRCWNWNNMLKKSILDINPDYEVVLEDSSLFKNDIMAATIRKEL